MPCGQPWSCCKGHEDKAYFSDPYAVQPSSVRLQHKSTADEPDHQCRKHLGTYRPHNTTCHSTSNNSTACCGITYYGAYRPTHQGTHHSAYYGTHRSANYGTHYAACYRTNCTARCRADCATYYRACHSACNRGRKDGYGLDPKNREEISRKRKLQR